MKKKKIRKNKNRTKRIILLLLLGIVTFGSATYAWFTANQVVTVNFINIKVEASNGIQISTNASEWKSVITNDDINAGYENSVNQLPEIVTNISTDGKVDTTTGRLNMYYGVIGTDANTGLYNLRTVKQTDVAGNEGRYVAFDIFLRVDQGQTIYLTSDSGVEADGEDKGLKNAARVGIVKLGHGSLTDSTNTLVNLKNEVATTAIIWEPNIDQHTDMVKDVVAPEYEVTIPATGSVPYRGISTTITTPVDLKKTINGTDTTNTAAVVPNIKTTANFTNYQEIFTLSSGVTKMRVYMWIEGQDIDCENGATGSNIYFSLQLSTHESANG